MGATDYEAELRAANEKVYKHSLELVRLKQALEVANDRLKELDQLKSEFLSVASHQLRAPITAIRGYTSLLLEGDYGAPPDPMKEPLRRIEESARNMASSIEDYLDISRIEQGRMKYEKSDFNVVELAQKVIDEMSPVASRKGLTLSLTPFGESLMVNADVGKIKQVISNLVDNAIKYTEKGGVTVTFAKESGKARILISDTGVGIAPDEIDGLFEKFKRARNANKVNTSGTGLGLYVAKQLIAGHNGSIHIESGGLGKGSSFIIELPIK